MTKFHVFLCVAVGCWLVLARRTWCALRRGEPLVGHTPLVEAAPDRGCETPGSTG